MVLIPICGAILSLKDVIARIKRNRLKGADSQIYIAILHANLNLDCSFCHELNLSTIDPPNNRMQMTPNIVEIRVQNFYGPESNIDCIYKWGNVRDQILPSPGRNIDRNLPRENIYDNIHGEGNNQNLYGYHLTRDNINTGSGRTGSSQSLNTNDQVFNPN